MTVFLLTYYEKEGDTKRMLYATFPEIIWQIQKTFS